MTNCHNCNKLLVSSFTYIDVYNLYWSTQSDKYRIASARHELLYFESVKGWSARFRLPESRESSLIFRCFCPYVGMRLERKEWRRWSKNPHCTTVRIYKVPRGSGGVSPESAGNETWNVSGWRTPAHRTCQRNRRWWRPLIYKRRIPFCHMSLSAYKQKRTDIPCSLISILTETSERSLPFLEVIIFNIFLQCSGWALKSCLKL